MFDDKITFVNDEEYQLLMLIYQRKSQDNKQYLNDIHLMCVNEYFVVGEERYI
jgi:hypothetical protein